MKLTRPQEVRKLISQVLSRLAGGAEICPRETVLIRNGYYCGHRFQSGDYQAVWFLEEDQIKFFGRDGALVHVVDSADKPSDELFTLKVA